MWRSFNRVRMILLLRWFLGQFFLWPFTLAVSIRCWLLWGVSCLLNPFSRILNSFINVFHYMWGHKCKLCIHINVNKKITTFFLWTLSVTYFPSPPSVLELVQVLLLETSSVSLTDNSIYWWILWQDSSADKFAT